MRGGGGGGGAVVYFIDMYAFISFSFQEPTCAL